MKNKNQSNQKLIEKINTLEKEYGSSFSNTQKILLTTDGSITTILDVLYGKINLSTIKQQIKKSTKENAKLLNICENEQINHREIIMHEKNNNQPLIYAYSLIPIKNLTPEVKYDLTKADIPIGRILKNYNFESRREIKNIYIQKPNPTLKKIYNTNEKFLSREYNIIQNNKILMWIKESFPTSYFQ